MALSSALVAVLGLVLSISAEPIIKAPYKHVAVFSVDGLHASDIPKYLKARPSSVLAELLETAYLYPNCNTSAPSDSYPGSLAAYTGATPRVTGVWYDVTYDRAFYPIGDSTCTGPAGTEVADDETLDYNSTELFSGGINPANLPYYKSNGKCAKLYPHNRLRVKTAFEVVQANGMQTAYTDKHPAYDIMRGPSGKGLTTGYFPEIAAIPTEVNATIQYDKLHVQAFLDWLDAKVPKHSEGNLSAIPALFGGNFQSVSVAQKAVGYLEKAGNPFSPAILQALDFVDISLGKVVQKLKATGIYNDTLIIVASKHGQAPIKRKLFNEVNPLFINNAAGVPVKYATTDDIALVFLNKSSDAATAAKNYQAQSIKGKVFQIFTNAGVGMSLKKNNFGSAATDPAVPDIIVVPDLGTIYTTSTSKVAEHGGFSNDDRNVACFVSSPKLMKKNFNMKVTTTQIAPLILKALGLDAGELDGAKIEKTKILPGFDHL